MNNERENERKDPRKGKEQEKPDTGTPVNQQPDAAKKREQDKKRAEEEGPDRSEFTDNPMDEDRDTGNKPREL